MGLNFRRLGAFANFACIVTIGFILAGGLHLRLRFENTARFDLICFGLVIAPALISELTREADAPKFALRLMLTLVVIWFGYMLTGYLRTLKIGALTAFSLAFPMGMVVYALAIGVMFLFGQFPEGYDWLANGGMPGFHNIRHIAFPIVPSLAMVICLASLTPESNPVARYAYYLIGAILWGFLIWAGSRGGNLAIGLALIVTLAVFGKHRWAVLKTSIIVFSFGAVLLYICTSSKLCVSAVNDFEEYLRKKRPVPFKFVVLVNV
jgi:hypothetical protein